MYLQSFTVYESSSRAASEVITSLQPILIVFFLCLTVCFVAVVIGRCTRYADSLREGWYKAGMFAEGEDDDE